MFCNKPKQRCQPKMDNPPEEIEKARKAKQLIYILMAIFIIVPIIMYVLQSAN